MKKKNIINSVGKRKTSVARVTLVKGKGNILINGKKLEEYFNNEQILLKIREPLILSQKDGQYDIKVNVSGGGISSQSDAVRMAIAQAIIKETNNDDIKEEFLDYDRSLLVADVRFKEPNKPNDSKARAKRQKSYR